MVNTALCEKYFSPNEIKQLISNNNESWFIQAAVAVELLGFQIVTISKIWGFFMSFMIFFFKSCQGLCYVYIRGRKYL